MGGLALQPAAPLRGSRAAGESAPDYRTLATGKKVQVPFDQLIISSTNLVLIDADEAFLRRIPYKIEIVDPSIEEFRKLFQSACLAMGCPYQPQAVDYLVQTHYRPYGVVRAEALRCATSRPAVEL